MTVNQVEQNFELSTEVPSTREYHNFIYYGGALWLIGGKQGSTALNDIYKFNVTTQSWAFETQIQFNTTVNIQGYQSVRVGNMFYFSFGCNTLLNTCFDYLLSYNVDTKIWKTEKQMYSYNLIIIEHKQMMEDTIIL